MSYSLRRHACDGRLFLVLVANGCTESVGGGGDRGLSGQFRTKDGREIVWSCSTPDGKVGHVVIDGQTFDLTRGALFLISTKDKPTRVQQVPVEAGQLQEKASIEKFRELEKADPRIAAFLKSCRDSK
jgi:hypothetical protein